MGSRSGRRPQTAPAFVLTMNRCQVARLSRREPAITAGYLPLENSIEPERHLGLHRFRHRRLVREPLVAPVLADVAQRGVVEPRESARMLDRRGTRRTG